jgi:long-chain fatty acid transport protein
MNKFFCWLSFVGVIIFPGLVHASGFGVFTQGASGLGQANAVVAHTTGPSSLYFNPALLNDVPGRQVEVGTTGVYADRNIKLDGGGSEDAESNWNFPSTFYNTQRVNDQVAAGLGVFFPFGLSSEWDEDYAGRYLGTEAELFSTNINPAVSFRVNDKLSLAAGVDILYLDASITQKINQDALLTGGLGLINDIEQKFEGDGWGVGYNLGALYKVNELVSIGATYRSKVDVTLDGEAEFDGVYPGTPLATMIQDTDGEADITLPQQFTAGVAVKPNEKLVVEVGVRWEDWESTDDLTVELDQPVLGQTKNTLPRDWKATWSYNIGGQYQLNETVAINAGYLYGKDCVPDSTFEPLIPDTDAHLFTIGTDLHFGAWIVSGAFGYEYHEDRDKDNSLGDPITNAPQYTANGTYETDIYLVGLSVGYKF